MRDIIFYIVWHFPCMKEQYPMGNHKAFDANYHISFYLEIGMFINILALMITPWINLALVPLFLQIFYRELIEDGHLKRIWNKTETEYQLRDVKCDVLTRLAGIIIPVIIGVICTLSR